MAPCDGNFRRTIFLIDSRALYGFVFAAHWQEMPPKLRPFAPKPTLSNSLVFNTDNLLRSGLYHLYELYIQFSVYSSTDIMGYGTDITSYHDIRLRHQLGTPRQIPHHTAGQALELSSTFSDILVAAIAIATAYLTREFLSTPSPDLET